MVSLHAVLLAACGFLLLLLTLFLVRRGLLTARYALGWVGISVVAILGSPLFAYLATKVEFVRLTPAGFAISVSILFLLGICVQLSVSLSGLIRANQDIAERLALLEADVVSASGARSAEGGDVIAITGASEAPPLDGVVGGESSLART